VSVNPLDTTTSPQSRPVGAPVLRVTDVYKAFGGTQALAGVSFELAKGSVHALLGGNGSGKSTVIKILAGVYEADAGDLEFGDQRIDAPAMTPSRARDAGLRFVHQQQSTFPELTVAENLAIGNGFETGAIGRVRWSALHRRTAGVLERFHIDAKPRMLLGELNPAAQAMVIIARALQDQEGEHDGVLILDEPTASLPKAEVDLLLAALKRYAADGQTILYVTHRLEEVKAIADRATIFRDGHVAATVEASEMTHQGLVELIMGRKVEEIMSGLSDAARERDALVRVRGLSGGPIADASFDLGVGEIVGIAGLLGSGRSTLLRMLFGEAEVAGGTIELKGETIAPASPGDAISAGIAYVPEDRLRDAAFVDMSVTENLGITTTGRYFRGARLRHRSERTDAAELMERYAVKAAGPSAPFASMSGGNQQKVILARWMRRQPSVLLLDEPTQGVDVGARADIWQLVRKAVDEGATALVVSSDVEELPRVCDRVLVLREGRIITELSGPDLTEERLDHLLLAEGVQQ
jgi:ribose transport system ATP-binding protein